MAEGQPKRLLEYKGVTRRKAIVACEIDVDGVRSSPGAATGRSPGGSGLQEEGMLAGQYTEWCPHFAMCNRAEQFTETGRGHPPPVSPFQGWRPF